MTIDEYILVELFKESEMTIDMAIETIAYIASKRRNILNRLEREACANAISTMRKYQIIVNDLKACEQDGMEFISVGFLKEIIDGNVD